MFRLGALVRFVPNSGCVGFTSGIAVLIALTQIRDFFELKIDKMPVVRHCQSVVDSPRQRGAADAPRWRDRAHRHVSMASVESKSPCACGCVDYWVRLPVWLVRRYFPQTGIATVGFALWRNSACVPNACVPGIQWEARGSFAATGDHGALLAAIESLLCAVVADHEADLIGDDKRDANQS